MSNSKIAPVSLAERIEVVDVLRGLAIGGILIGNMQWFSGYGMMPPEMAAQAPAWDQVVHFLVHLFIEGKFYSIFSFLFGFGFALQIARAAERGDDKASLFKRRLYWLLVIGLLHGWLLWAGDILSVYAVMGFILLLFRKKETGSLLKWSIGLMIVPIVTYLLLYAGFAMFAPPDTNAGQQQYMTELWNQAIVTVREGSYFRILKDFNVNYIIGRYMGLIFQMRLPKILAMFLLGFYAYRRGIFQDLKGNAAFIRKVSIYGLTLGVIGNMIFAAVAGSEADLPPTALGFVGVVTYSFGVPAMELGIIALVVTLWQTEAFRGILGLLAPVGRMAMTNYLMQTVICVLIFYGYGLGQFGKHGAARVTLIALGIFAFQIAASSLWLRFFGYGPMEWIWRQLTYQKRLPLRRRAGA